VGFHPLKTNREKDPCGAKNSEENLEKDSPYVLLVFAWNQSPHRVGSKVVVQLVDMEKGFVGFPTIASFSKACPTDLEFHRGPF
jgi:hypothetical protein